MKYFLLFPLTSFRELKLEKYKVEFLSKYVIYLFGLVPSSSSMPPISFLTDSRSCSSLDLYCTSVSSSVSRWEVSSTHAISSSLRLSFASSALNFSLAKPTSSAAYHLALKTLFLLKQFRDFSFFLGKFVR